MSKTNLNFHLTFRPERQYISSLLGSIDSCDGVDIQEISATTGIPTGKSSGKVEPTIRYTEYMGLLKKQKADGKYTFLYTPLGQCVADEDLVFHPARNWILEKRHFPRCKKEILFHGKV